MDIYTSHYRNRKYYPYLSGLLFKFGFIPRLSASWPGGICVDYAQSGTGNKTLAVCLTAGITYYLVLDSWPLPACNAYSNLTISAPVPAGGCSLGTGQVAVPSLPYVSTARTTCGKIDDITSTNSVTCGSASYFTGEDEVFVFTPASSGTSTISVTSVTLGRYYAL